MAIIGSVNSRIMQLLVIVFLLVLIGVSGLVVSVAADAFAAQSSTGPGLTPTYTRGNFPIAATPTPAPLRMVSVNPSAIADARNGIYTDSPLLYSVESNSIHVIEVNTNKVIDIIHFDKNIQVYDAAVNSDYTKLYVLYYDSPDPYKQDNDNYNYDSYRYFYIATVDLKTDQVVDNTKDHGVQSVYMRGQPVKMLLSKDGKYLYMVFYGSGVSMIYQYDVNANAVTRYMKVNSMYAIETGWGNVVDMALSPDGASLYVTDAGYETIFKLNIPDMNKYSKIRPEYYTDDEPVLQGIDVSLDSQTIYVGNYDNANRSFFIIRTGAMTPQNGPGFIDVDTTHMPTKVKAGPDGKKIHALAPDANAVETWVFDVNAIWKDAEYTTGGEPIDMALSPDGSSLYVLNSADNTVTALDINNKAAFSQSPIKIGMVPRRLSMGTQPAGSIWVNTSHNVASIKNPNTAAPITVSRSSSSLPNNASAGIGTGFRRIANGTFIPITSANDGSGFQILPDRTFIPITLVNQTPSPSPTPKASRMPIISARSIPTSTSNATEIPSSAASTIPADTPRAASTPGFEGIIGALCLAGVSSLIGKK
jgi:DNA-binding beta-propeller fold protein YncE